MPSETGPYLQVACFCEMVIEDKSGVLSLMRIIDTISQSAVGPNPPDDMPPLAQNLSLVLMMKSGQARGRATITLTPEKPSGLKDHPQELTAHFEGDERGANFVTKVNYLFDQEGVYWFHIYLDGEHWTSVPMRIKYSRVVTGQQATN